MAKAKTFGGAWTANCDPAQLQGNGCGSEGKKVTAIRQHEGKASGVRWDGVRVQEEGIYEVTVKYSNSGSELSAKMPTPNPVFVSELQKFPSQRGKNAGSIGEVTHMLWLDKYFPNTIEISSLPSGDAPEIIGITVRPNVDNLRRRAIALGANTFEFCNYGGYVAAFDLQWAVAGNVTNDKVVTGRETTGNVNAGQCRTFTAPAGAVSAKVDVRRFTFFNPFNYDFSPVWEGQKGDNNVTTGWFKVQGAGVKAKFSAHGTTCNAWSTSQSQSDMTKIITEDIDGRGEKCGGNFFNGGTMIGPDNTDSLGKVLVQILFALFGGR
ncbi:hypothetical protein ACFUOZ_21150 [Paenarthrobacter sp. NPDC057355]|uniref:hypothetical protein n=1 Tax=Paenarthrobacter sp. NPDC057355 TaxID=3346105 RepID=UPI0036438ABD